MGVRVTDPASAQRHRYLVRVAGGAGNASRRLVFFPYAGGGDAAARAIADHLPLDMEVWTVSLPGSAFNLAARTEPIERSAAAIAEAVAALPALPTVLWGHSLGTLFAFETARRLEADHAPRVNSALIVSGARAPDRLSLRAQTMSSWSNERLTQYLSGLGGLPAAVLNLPEFLQFAVERFRRDIALGEQYVFESGPPLRQPLIALGGAEDAAVPSAEISHWTAHAERAEDVEVRILPGDHFFILTRLDEIARIVDAAARAASTMAEHDTGWSPRMD